MKRPLFTLLSAARGNGELTADNTRLRNQVGELAQQLAEAGEAIAEADKKAAAWRRDAEGKAAKVARLRNALEAQTALTKQLRAALDRAERSRNHINDLPKLPLTTFGHLGIARPVDPNPRYAPPESVHDFIERNARIDTANDIEGDDL